MTHTTRRRWYPTSSLMLVAALLAACTAGSSDPSSTIVESATTLASAATTPASATTQTTPSASSSLYESALDAAVQKVPVKAVLIGIAEGDATPWLAARGESMTGVPATPDMHFRNGAVAISYLGTLLLLMVEQGVVALDDPLAKWFPDYPEADKVTLEMLIHGTSGYPDYVPDEGFLKALHDDPFRAWTPDQLLDIAFSQPVHCPPGTCFSYAHTNFVILGAVLAKAAGKPLAVLVKEKVLDPLQLTGTFADQTARIPEPVLHAFDGERGTYEESTFWNPSWTLADGLIQTSTIADVLKSATAIGAGTLLTPESHQIQLEPVTAKFPPMSDENYYAYGHYVAKGWILQIPSFNGYAATMAYLPSRKLSIAIAVTVDETADPERNYSTDILSDITKTIVPEAAIVGSAR